MDTEPLHHALSFPSSRGKSMEQLAVVSDVIKDLIYLQIQPEDTFFLPLSHKSDYLLLFVK